MLQVLVSLSNANTNRVLRLEHVLKRSTHIRDKNNDIRVIKETLQIRKAIIFSTTKLLIIILTNSNHQSLTRLLSLQLIIKL